MFASLPARLSRRARCGRSPSLLLLAAAAAEARTVADPAGNAKLSEGQSRKAATPAAGEG